MDTREASFLVPMREAIAEALVDPRNDGVIQRVCAMAEVIDAASTNPTIPAYVACLKQGSLEERKPCLRELLPIVENFVQPSG